MTDIPRDFVNIRKFVRGRKLHQNPRDITPKPIDFHNMPPPPKWIIKDFACNGPTLISGPSNVGKSWIAMQLAICTSAGIPFLEREILDPGPVIYWDCEDKPNELGLRAQEVCQAFGIHLTDLANKLHLYGGEKLTVGRGPEWKELLDVCAVHNPRMLILDPAMAMLHGKPNANEDVNEFFVHLRHFTETLNSSVVVIHHTPKHSSSTPLGAQRWEGAPDILILAMNGALRWSKIRSARGEMPEELGFRFEETHPGQCLVADALSPMRRIITALQRTGELQANDTGYRTLAEELRVDDFTARKWVDRAIKKGYVCEDGRGSSKRLSIGSVIGLGLDPAPVDAGDDEYWK